MHERITYVEYDPDFSKLTRKKRVCAYARVSSDKDEAFHSLSSQISYYQKKIAEHQDWEFVEVFADRGITGTKEKREGFQRMLTACREGKVDIVLAKSITRFARNTVILLETVRELKKLGIDIHFEEEHIETLSEKGEFMISILAARAQEESRSASENQKWRIRKSYEKGIPVTGNCLGYRMVDHQFLIDEEEEQIVLRIFSMYLAGMGKSKIVRKLNQDGIKSPCGKHWTEGTIHWILRNEKYCGDLKLQKKYRTDHITKHSKLNKGERPQYEILDSHDPIIDRETFNHVQERIKEQRKLYTARMPDEQYLFTGMIRCGKCNKKYRHGITACGTKYQKPIWICPTFNFSGKDVCDSQRIPEDILIDKTKEILGVSELNRDIILFRIREIVVPEKNTLVYILKDGTEKTIEWEHRSRSKSWTPEMKAKAREKMKSVWEERKNGS